MAANVRTKHNSTPKTALLALWLIYENAENSVVSSRFCAVFGKGLCIKDNVLIELACGTGQLSRRMAGSVRRWDATDFSENMIGQAKKKGETEKLHFYVADATKLSCENGSFDAVVISCALHIIPDPEAVLAEILRVLKPEGLLYCPTYLWAESSAFGRVRQSVMSLAGFKVYREWTLKSFTTFIEKYGFCVLKQESFDAGIAPIGVVIAKRLADHNTYIISREEKHDDK